MHQLAELVGGPFGGLRHATVHLPPQRLRFLLILRGTLAQPMQTARSARLHRRAGRAGDADRAMHSIPPRARLVQAGAAIARSATRSTPGSDSIARTTSPPCPAAPAKCDSPSASRSARSTRPPPSPPSSTAPVSPATAARDVGHASARPIGQMMKPRAGRRLPAWCLWHPWLSIQSTGASLHLQQPASLCQSQPPMIHFRKSVKPAKPHNLTKACGL